MMMMMFTQGSRTVSTSAALRLHARKLKVRSRWTSSWVLNPPLRTDQPRNRWECWLRSPTSEPRPTGASAFSTASAASSSTGRSAMEALKDVRSRSGAPIVECKKALKAVADAGGGASGTDVVALALDWLREHGAAKAASKLRDREATEGLVCVAISPDGKRGSLVQVSSETDFAGRSDRFLDLATTVADAALKQKLCRNGPVPLEGLLELPDGATGKTIRDLLDEAVVAIRENLGVSHAAAISCNEDGGDDDSIVVGYVHNRVGSSSAGTAAAIVELGSADPAKRPVGSEVLQAVGKKLAMHVVAAKPQHLRLQDVPGEAVDRELEILRKQQEGSGKPPEIVEKVVQGRLRKFYESVCLLDQPHFIEDKNPKVGSYLSEQGIVVKRFEARSIAS